METFNPDEVEALRELAGAYRLSKTPVEAARKVSLGDAAMVSGSPVDGAPVMMKPRVGEIVIYRARSRNYVLPAIVTANVETLDRRGVIRGDVPDITAEDAVHLNVQTCGRELAYQEHDIPFSREPIPGTWAWR